ncbi:MAG: cell division protein FtsZ [Bacteroidia bacterium]
MESTLRFNMPKERSSIIKVLGVGGGGGNAINYMYQQGIKGVDFIICNTDVQALEASPIPTKIQLGSGLTQGLGAGSNPEVGKQAAIEAIEDIIDMLGVNTKMLFITAGMGGGTGTGAAPIIAKTAKDMNILTVGIVTTPFSFEGKRRQTFANEGIEALKKTVDCLLVINNDKIKEMYGNLPLRHAFSNANDILNTAAKGIAEIITYPGFINVDFEDVKTVMKSSGVAIMGSAKASGENRAINAVKEALASPLLNNNKIVGAQNILLNISSAEGDNELTMDEFSEISNYIQKESGNTAEMIIGTSYDETLNDNIGVTLVATGFETGSKQNTIIIGSTVDNKQPINEPKTENKATVLPEPNKIDIDNKTEEVIKYNLFDEDKKKGESIENEMKLEIRNEEDDEETFEAQPELKKTEIVNNNRPITEPTFNKTNDLAEQKDKAKQLIDRVNELKLLNNKISSSEGLKDLENVPAYKRKQLKLDEVPHSASIQVSRLSLFEDNSGKPEIKSNNSFLHDNVD